jgi:hypothetical protein
LNDERRGYYTARPNSRLALSGASIGEACVKLINRIEINDELLRIKPFGDDAAVSN